MGRISGVVHHAKQRSSPGYTRAPWPCCGAEPKGQRRKEGICPTCLALLEEGRRFRKLPKAGDETYAWTSKDYGFPGYHMGHLQHEVHDQLKRAMFALVGSVALGLGDHLDYKAKRAASYLLNAIGNGGWSWGYFVRLKPDVRTAIDALDQAIRAALTDAHQQGKEQGASILRGLASGDTSLTDFEEGIAPASERRRR